MSDLRTSTAGSEMAVYAWLQIIFSLTDSRLHRKWFSLDGIKYARAKNNVLPRPKVVPLFFQMNCDWESCVFVLENSIGHFIYSGCQKEIIS